MSNKINQKELAKMLVAANFAITYKDAINKLDILSDIIVQSVAKGRAVKINYFGKFYPYKLKSGKIVPKFKSYQHFQNLLIV